MGVFVDDRVALQDTGRVPLLPPWDTIVTTLCCQVGVTMLLLVSDAPGAGISLYRNSQLSREGRPGTLSLAPA